MTMWRLFLVGAGGFVGSAARYWLSGQVQAWSGPDFPTGTMAVNGLGSFVLGLVMALGLERQIIGAELRIFLAVGVCGGFTTMSTFSYETLALLQRGALGPALMNVSVTLALCVGAVWIGAAAGRIL